MLHEQNVFYKRFMIVVDSMILVVSFLLAYKTRNIEFFSSLRGLLYPFEYYSYLLVITVPTFIIIFSYFGFYSLPRPRSIGMLLSMGTKSILVSFFVLAGFIFMFKLDFVSRIFLGIYTFYSFVLIIMSRILILFGTRYFTPREHAIRNILLCGDFSKVQEFIEHVEKQKEWGINITGILSRRNSWSSDKQSLFDIPVLGSMSDLEQILRKIVIDEVIFTFEKQNVPDMENWILICEKMGVTACIVADFFKVLFAKTYIESLYGLPLLTYSTVPYNYSELLFKRVIDIIGSLAGLIILSPLFLILTLAIKFNSRGSVFYKQLRLGQNGRKFVMYKFRSMIIEADQMRQNLESENEMHGPVFKIKNDPRVTRVGKLLRKYSLDEIPQIINVLQGEMSLVGPRPPIPEEVDQYDLWQRRRLSMKPGLTCLWQISGRNKIDFEEWMRLDLEYIDNWSLWLDFWIMMRTIPAILSARGAS
ncbi:sugar transferase [candidate division CSSED10-310 bacterium]|uniref:Sugar transferase n=1 Tax=candidate division CSSED10-310 bacterium TaxID=2855610 RepID=A0ABV6Z187_UNCC1